MAFLLLRSCESFDSDRFSTSSFRPPMYDKAMRMVVSFGNDSFLFLAAIATPSKFWIMTFSMPLSSSFKSFTSLTDLTCSREMEDD